MEKVVLPRLFENMEEGTIGRWLVSEGESIAAGTPLCELITEKTTLELPSEVGGVVRQLVAPEKAVVPPGFIIALVGTADEPLINVEADNAALQKSVAVEMPPVEAAPKPATPTVTSVAAGGRLRATPAARRAAKDLGVDLEAVAKRFEGKVLSEEDVKRFAEESQ